MIGFVAFLVVSIGIAISLFFVAKLQQFDRRLSLAERVADSEPAPPSLPEPPPSRPLEGLRIAISVLQDHTHPVFANLLREQLLREDVTEIEILSAGEAADLKANWSERTNGPDILILGEVTCNGYAEIYYVADFSCFSANQTICTLTQKPPHGDRPLNLAIELIAMLKVELEKLVSRSERRRALRELSGGL